MTFLIMLKSQPTKQIERSTQALTACVVAGLTHAYASLLAPRVRPRLSWTACVRLAVLARSSASLKRRRRSSRAAAGHEGLHTLLCMGGRGGRARFAFGPLKPGFASSDRLASPIGGSARPCGRRCRLWARDGALRAHFFAAYFGLDTASRGTARLSFARLGPVLDAGNPQPSASCCRGLGFGEQGKALLKLVSTLEFTRGPHHILRGRFRRFHAFCDVWST